MTIYDLLREDHRRVEKLFAKIRNTRDADAKYALFLQLKEELLSHAKAEERVFYLRTAPAAPAEIMHAKKEHTAVELMLLELDDLEVDDGAFDTKLAELEQNVKHHVEEEESTIFAKARSILGDDADGALAAKMLEQEDKEADKLEERDQPNA